MISVQGEHFSAAPQIWHMDTDIEGEGIPSSFWILSLEDRDPRISVATVLSHVEGLLEGG